jgi:hypothetical protein
VSIFEVTPKFSPMKTLNVFFLMVLLLPLVGLKAQNTIDTSDVWRVVMINGNEFIGNVTGTDDKTIFMKTSQLGEISIPRAEIKIMQKLDKQKFVSGSYWAENPQSCRYFWAPNGYGLRKGEGYYQNVWVFYNQASYGVSDYFSIGAAVLPLFLFGGTPTPAFITPKFSIPLVRDKVNIGVGAIAGTVLGASETGAIGIVYGVSTFGNHDNNLSVGLGYGFAQGEWAQKPLIELSGMLRVSRSTYLMSENYFISFGENGFSLVSVGARSIIKNSASIDYGLIIPVGRNMDTFIAIPWLGLTIPFGNKAGKMPPM